MNDQMKERKQNTDDQVRSKTMKCRFRSAGEMVKAPHQLEQLKIVIAVLGRPHNSESIESAL